MKLEKLTTLILATPALMGEVIRNPEQVSKDLLFDDAGNVKVREGAKAPTLAEIGLYTAKGTEFAESTLIRSANVLRIARGLPEVTLKDGEKEVKVTAFEVAKAHFRRHAKTEGAFYNMLQVVTAIDTREALKLPDTLSPFVLKGQEGTLKALGIIEEVKKEGKPSTLRIANGNGKKAMKELAKSLKDGTAGVNNIRPMIEKAKAAAETPDEKKAREEKEKSAEKDKYTPAIVQRDIRSLVGIWEKAVGFHGLDKVREACAADVEVLAKLAGLGTVKLPPPTPAKAK